MQSFKCRTTRQLYRKEKIVTPTQYDQTETVKSIEDGIEQIEYEVTLNGAGLDAMARKAAANKSQKSSDGPVTVRIVNRRRSQ